MSTFMYNSLNTKDKTTDIPCFMGYLVTHTTPARLGLFTTSQFNY